MDESRRDAYAAALRAKQAELLSGLRKREGLAAENEPDVFDESQRAADRALIVENLDRSSALLREVRSALERIQDGTYGGCLQCAQEINPKRLAVVPWARFCLQCQEKADREERPQPRNVAFLKAA